MLAAVTSVSAQSMTDSLKVLIVFVKFADDVSAGGPEVDYRSWRRYEDPTRLPDSAPYLLSPEPHPPFADSTLTAYFYQQSNGNLVIFGDVYPRTIVSSGPEADYHRPRGGYGDLTADVVRQIDTEGLDFSRYDYNRDGLVDHLFLILRSDTQKDSGAIPWTGASCLDARCANGPPVGRYFDPITIDGVRIDWNLSGSIIFNRVPGNVFPHYWLVRMMAHEIGHDFWRSHFIHVPAITSNDVPTTSNYTPPTNTIGYVLMAGAGGGRDVRGDETISAFERHLLGWIDCPVLSVSGADIRIRDLYTSGDCFRILPDAGNDRTAVFISNRQRIGPFDRYRHAGVDGRFEIGLLRTTGLLVGLADRNRFDVLPADNSLELSVSNAAYQGDLFGPGSRRQLTPWTRPTINGYTERRTSRPLTWSAIDNIRSDARDPEVLAFDFLSDFRDGPVVRENSWISWETSDQVIRGPVSIVDGATLTVLTRVEMNGRVSVHPSSTLRVAEGATLVLGSRAMLTLTDSAGLVVEGTLVVAGIIAPQAGSAVVLGQRGVIRRATGP